jgi:hypothetical protein
MGIEIRGIFRHISPSIDICLLGAETDMESITCDFANSILGVAVHAEINNVLGEGILDYSTVTRRLHEKSVADSSEACTEESETEECDLIDNAILQIFDKQSFASHRQLAKPILTPMATIRHHSVSKMEYKLKHFK